MPATIRPVGMLKEYIDGEDERTVESGMSVRQAMESLGIPPEIVALVMVNDEQQSKDYILKDGDKVKLIAIIGGG